MKLVRQSRAALGVIESDVDLLATRHVAAVFAREAALFAVQIADAPLFVPSNAAVRKKPSLTSVHTADLCVR